MLIEVHYRKVESTMVAVPNSSNGSLEHKLLNNVTQGERVLINTDKIVFVCEREYSNRTCANVFTDDDGEAFKLYESMDEIIAMVACVRSFN